MVGAENVASGVSSDTRGAQLPFEQILAHQPDIFIGTGLFRPGDGAGFQLGMGPSVQDARRSLLQVVGSGDLAEPDAVRAGRAHGLWNFFAGIAISALTVEELARWI